MELPEHERKARRSSKLCKDSLPRVKGLLEQLGLRGEMPRSREEKALLHKFDTVLKTYTDKFLAKKKLKRDALTEWQNLYNQDVFRQMATSFLQEGGRGAYYWPEVPSAANKNGYRYSRDRKKICDLVTQLGFRRNKDFVRNEKDKARRTYIVTMSLRRTTDAAQTQPCGSSATDTPRRRMDSTSGSSFESPIDVDGLPDYAFDPWSDDEDTSVLDGPSSSKLLHDPGFPSPEPDVPPMVPQPATVEDQVDEHYFGRPNHIFREQTYTICPEEADATSAQDQRDTPSSPKAATPVVNKCEKRPAESDPEDHLARRTKSPRMRQDNVTITTAGFAADDDDDDDDAWLHSPVGRVTNTSTDGEPRRAQLHDYVPFDGPSSTDSLPGPASHQGSPELGEEAHRAALAQRKEASTPSDKAPLALMSDVAASEPEAGGDMPQKQPETDPLEDDPFDDPPKAQADLGEETPQEDAPSTQLEAGDDPQGKPQSQPPRSEEPEQRIKGGQQPETLEDALTNKETTPLNFAFTVYQTEMRPMVWNYSETLFFSSSLRELVDDLPMEDKDTLRGLCVTLMGKRPDQYQVFLYNDVKYSNVKEIYLTTIKQEMQEARLDGSRLDYELIFRPIR